VVVAGAGVDVQRVGERAQVAGQLARERVDRGGRVGGDVDEVVARAGVEVRDRRGAVDVEDVVAAAELDGAVNLAGIDDDIVEVG